MTDASVWQAAAGILFLSLTGDALAASQGRGRIPLSPSRQVNERWLYTLRPWAYAAGFGFQLGAGVVTVINSWSVWVAVVGAFLSRNMAFGAVVGVVFGVTRGALLLLGARVTTTESLMRLGRGMELSGRRSQVAAVLVQAFVLVAILSVEIRGGIA